MNILLCSVPDGAVRKIGPLIPRGHYDLEANLKPTFPLGIQRVLSSVQEHAYNGEIYDISYKELEKYRTKEGKQKYNFFVDPKEIKHQFKFTNERYLKSTRPIENSLRSIVKQNSVLLSKNYTKEQADLDKIAKMQ